MDMVTVRIVIELVTFAAFVAIVAWAWSGHRAKDFDAAARLPFEGHERGEP
jgi:cytochrome c oxidase cbb3-type subunit 4